MCRPIEKLSWKGDGLHIQLAKYRVYTETTYLLPYWRLHKTKDLIYFLLLCHAFVNKASQVSLSLHSKQKSKAGKQKLVIIMQVRRSHRRLCSSPLAQIKEHVISVLTNHWFDKGKKEDILRRLPWSVPSSEADCQWREILQQILKTAL